MPRLSPRLYEGRRCRLPEFLQTFPFYEEKLSFTEAQEWFAATGVSASAKHKKFLTGVGVNGSEVLSSCTSWAIEILEPSSEVPSRAAALNNKGGSSSPICRQHCRPCVVTRLFASRKPVSLFLVLRNPHVHRVISMSLIGKSQVLRNNAVVSQEIAPFKCLRSISAKAAFKIHREIS